MIPHGWLERSTAASGVPLKVQDHGVIGELAQRIKHRN